MIEVDNVEELAKRVKARYGHNGISHMFDMAAAMHSRGVRWAPDSIYLPSDFDIKPLDIPLAGSITQWAAHGFQVVEPADRLAASLMATRGLKGLKMPWPAWAIRVPNGLVAFDGIAGMEHVSHVVVRTCYEVPADLSSANELALSGRPVSGFEVTFGSVGGGAVRMPIGSLDELDSDRSVDDLNRNSHPPTDDPFDLGDRTSADARAMTLIGRLILGVIAEMDGGIAKRRILLLSDRKKTKAANLRLSPWVLCRPVRLDVRSECLEYCLGGGRSPGVRTLVRGHWKRQVHGPARSLRKWIHVEPFWRGPLEAAVAVRPHTIGGLDE